MVKVKQALLTCVASLSRTAGDRGRFGSWSARLRAMPEVIVIEVDCDPALYPKVNQALGLDPATGSGDWRKSLLSHLGGGADGKVVVVEVWESRADEENWMATRLG